MRYAIIITDDEKRIERMLNLAISNDTDFSWRAAWLIGKFAQSENEILKPHYLRIINAIEGKDSGHQRELLKLVINKSLTDEEEGRLLEIVYPNLEGHTQKARHKVICLSMYR